MAVVEPTVTILRAAAVHCGREKTYAALKNRTCSKHYAFDDNKGTSIISKHYWVGPWVSRLDGVLLCIYGTVRYYLTLV